MENVESRALGNVRGESCHAALVRFARDRCAPESTAKASVKAFVADELVAVAHKLRPEGVCWLVVEDWLLHADRTRPGDLVNAPALVTASLGRTKLHVRASLVLHLDEPRVKLRDRPWTQHLALYLLSKRSRYTFDHFAGLDPQHRAALATAARYPSSDSVWPWHLTGAPVDLDAIGRCVELATPRRVCEGCGMPWKRRRERGTGDPCAPARYADTRGCECTIETTVPGRVLDAIGHPAIVESILSRGFRCVTVASEETLAGIASPLGEVLRSRPETEPRQRRLFP